MSQVRPPAPEADGDLPRATYQVVSSASSSCFHLLDDGDPRCHTIADMASVIEVSAREARRQGKNPCNYCFRVACPLCGDLMRNTLQNHLPRCSQGVNASR